MEELQKMLEGHRLLWIVAGIVAFLWVAARLRQAGLRTVLYPVWQALMSLEMADESTIGKMTSGNQLPSPGDRLCFHLRLDEALVVIQHFFHDPRYWLAQMGMFSLPPNRVPYDNSWDTHGQVLVLRHRTIMGPVVDIELLQFARVGQEKFLIRIETDSRDWYMDAYHRYPDLRRAVSGVLGERERDVL
jgi:hypothetical protein